MTTGPQANDGALPDAKIDRRLLPAAMSLVTILAAMSGVVDTVAYQRFGVFVANQTGNLVIIMVDLTTGRFDNTLIASLVSLVFFIGGVFAAVALRNALRRTMSRHRVRVILLMIETACIGIVAFAVLALGEGRLAYGAIALLAVSQGFQGVVVTRVVGVATQSVVINAAIVQVADWWSSGRRRAAYIAVCVPVGYLLGAAIGAILLRFPAPSALMSALALAVLAVVIATKLRSRGGDLD